MATEAAEVEEEVAEAVFEPDTALEEQSETSEASPIIAVEVAANGDVRLEDHEDERYMETGQQNTESVVVTPISDLLSDTSRHICIVTTAALPWRTGTAVNPLLRALFLSRQGRPVTLLIPWLPSAAERTRLYGTEHSFTTSDEQTAWIRNYCVERCNCTREQADQLGIRFWEGAYNETFGSIFPVVDICATIPAEEADVCVLEEPEHLNWFRVPSDPSDLGWTSKFRHVVGILHTNYGDYVRQYGLGFSAPALNSLSSLVVKAYCHRIIRLSATLPHLDPSKEVTCNVHGVRPEFLEPPEERSDDTEHDSYAPVYFIGKLIWAKGFEHVLELQEKFKLETKSYFRMDVYGSGKEQAEIQKAFFGRRNAHASSSVSNGSTTDDSSNKANAVFEQPFSLRDHISQASSAQDKGEPATEEVSSTGETTTHEEEAQALVQTQTLSYEDEKKTCDASFLIDQAVCAQSDVGIPLEILGDISGKTYSTSIETAGAALRLIDSVISVGFADENQPKKSRGEAILKNVAPAKTRFKVSYSPIDTPLDSY